MRYTLPHQDYVLVEKVIHNKSSLILPADQITDDSLFDIVVVRVGPEVADSLIGKIVICSAGVNALPVDEPSHYLIKSTEIIGEISHHD